MPLYTDTGPSALTLPLVFQTAQIRADAVQASVDREPESAAYALRREARAMRETADKERDAVTVAYLRAEADRLDASAASYEALVEERRLHAPELEAEAAVQRMRATERKLQRNVAFGKAARDVLLQRAEELMAIGNYGDARAIREADAIQRGVPRVVPGRR